MHMSLPPNHGITEAKIASGCVRLYAQTLQGFCSSDIPIRCKIIIMHDWAGSSGKVWDSSCFWSWCFYFWVSFIKKMYVLYTTWLLTITIHLLFRMSFYFTLSSLTPSSKMHWPQHFLFSGHFCCSLDLP